MKHALQIAVTKKPINGGTVSCRKVSIRERFLRFMFGNKTALTVIVPGDTVQTLSVTEMPEGGTAHEAI